MKGSSSDFRLALLSIIFLLACGKSEKQLIVENAQKYQPSPAEQQQLIEELEMIDQQFDPAYNALKEYRSRTANRYHSDMIEMYVHPVRETAAYAVKLLESGEAAFRERAFKVIKAVIEAQDQDTTRETYGIWPYHFEEPLEEMNKPDWNWADFVSVQLLEAYMKFYEQIPDNLKSEMEEAILHASRSIQKRDVKPGYTNIAIMGTLVTHLAGHLFDDQELNEYAAMRMQRFYDYTRELKGFAEYNSPTYTRVALDELQRMKQYIMDPEALEMVDYCYHTAWKVMATHFHPPTAQLAGPHSRSYSTLMRDRFYDFLFGASNGKVAYGSAKKPGDYYKLQHQIPAEFIDHFLQLDEERVQIDTFGIMENPPVGYSYLTSLYTIGTVNKSTTWQQRRPYLIYWGTADNPKYFRVRLLHDFEDFGIGNIFSVQNKQEVLTAMNFATNGGDYHISIDRLEEGKFKAKDIRLRFEMANLISMEQIIDHEKGFSITDGDIKIHIHMLGSVFGDHEITMQKGSDDDLYWVDYLIYAGEEKAFDLTGIDQAFFIWHTQITGDNEAEKQANLHRDEDRITAGNDVMQLSIPVKPGLESDLQDGFSLRKN